MKWAVASLPRPGLSETNWNTSSDSPFFKSSRVSHRKGEAPRVRVRLNISFLLVLLALFVSYNLDLECVLADHGVCQQVCQESAEDICAEPSFGSPAIVALGSRVFVLQWLALETRTQAIVVYQEPRPSGPGLLSSVGLRAPPYHSAS